MKVAVVGHTEWAEFMVVDEVPDPGQIAVATESFELVAGGGAVAAVQLAKLAGGCLFLTALGDDERGRAAKAGLEELGVRVEAAWRPEPQRRAVVFLDASGERTITTINRRLGPNGADPLPWDELSEVDGLYLTAGDGDAARASRAARNVVATVRASDAITAAGIPVDVLVASAADERERYRRGDIEPEPALVARTAGAEGGTLTAPDGATTGWAPDPPPGPIVDAYGAGDSFAGGLTYGLAAGETAERAAAIGARCGASVMSGRGPYASQPEGLE